MKSVKAYKSLGILHIEDKAKQRKICFFLFMVFQFNALCKLIFKFQESRSHNIFIDILLFICGMLILFFTFKQVKNDVSNQISKDSIRDYEFKPNRFEVYGQLIIHLNNGRKRIIVIDNGLQLEVFSKEIESLGIPQKMKNEKNSNR
ncbi:MAG: hypothetical protein O9297_06940 [Flavobacterium sp.]|uniref:hypothetical protein n=2 Tax=Flavobacterium sp. TaxID=239 RepID=UPI0022C5BFED|nr:hypothetical protein [Flavobacterium sp.]MCZ8296939.1 hypothetical protein [Flavobacterium sp.]